MGNDQAAIHCIVVVCMLLTNSLSSAICAAMLGAMENTAAMLTGLAVVSLCLGLVLARKSADGRSTMLSVDPLSSMAGVD